MPKMVMVTEAFELTEDMRDLRSLNVKEDWIYDTRMDMVIPKRPVGDQLYVFIENYLKSFCELTNRNVNCRPAYLTACGFLPVWIESVVLLGMGGSVIVTEALQEAHVDFFYHKPMSPVNKGFEIINDTSNHDIWVNKLDAHKIVPDKPIHNITALDVLRRVV